MPDSTILATCRHERRPGTTTCLYCLKEERARVNARLRHTLARFTVGAVVGGIVITALIGGVTALASDSGSAVVMLDSATANQAGEVVPATKPAAPPKKVEVETPSMVPVIANGANELGDGVVATRSNHEVVVNFDTDLLRTRFDWKFEAVVRSTLPAVYGEQAREALDSVPSGRLVRGDLLEVLPEQGIPLALPEGDTLVVWPLTRPGRDGPIVVAYRAGPR